MKRLLLFLILFTSTIFSQWQLRNNGLPNSLVWAIDAFDRNNAVVSKQGMPEIKGVFITNDAGLNWRRIYNENVIDIVMKNASTIFAVTDRAVIKTTNSGAKWDTLFQYAANVGMFNYIKVFQNKIITMADADLHDYNCPAQFYISNDGGTSWGQANSGSLIGGITWDTWHPLDFGGQNVGIFGYCYPTTPGSQYLSHGFARTTNGGSSWIPITLPGVQNIPAIDLVKMANTSYGLAYANDGTYNAKIYITRDGGASWTNYPFDFSYMYGQCFAFIPSDQNKVFLSAGSRLFYSDNGGMNWTLQSTPITDPNEWIRDMTFVDQDCGWMATTNGSVYWTDNKGNAIVSAEKEKKLPSKYSLEQNYPNPFNPSTTINFSLPAGETPYMASLRVTLKIYDLLGREIKTLVDKEMSPGNYTVTWNADDNYGKKVSTGIYLFSLNAGTFTQTRKMILLK